MRSLSDRSLSLGDDGDPRPPSIRRRQTMAASSANRSPFWLRSPRPCGRNKTTQSDVHVASEQDSSSPRAPFVSVHPSNRAIPARALAWQLREFLNPGMREERRATARYVPARRVACTRACCCVRARPGHRPSLDVQGRERPRGRVAHAVALRDGVDQSRESRRELGGFRIARRQLLGSDGVAR